MPSIDRNSSEPFYLQVYDQITAGIESGLYPAGNKLPSIRECARELGVSNTTIELAYQKLTEEGYVQARRGSGYTICKIDSALINPSKRFTPDYLEALGHLKESEVQRASKHMPTYDFAYDTIDPSLFPYTAWARISREVFFVKGADRACLYNDRQGLVDLRKQIANYICSEYGLTCIPEQIMVMPTTRDLISAIMSLFDPHDTRFAMENPGYDEVSRRLASQGYNVSTIPVWPYPNWDDALDNIEGARIVFSTPGCQFPTNHPMSLETRKNLVEWAWLNDAYIIDDEYGWEFQSGISRIPPLAALDHSGHVITIGTFSNSFSPAISLSYAVMPPQLMNRWQETKRDAHPQVPWQTQAAMAMFMSEGHWRTHIRRMRTAMRRKRNTLLQALERYMGYSIDVLSGPTSLFMLVQLHDGRTEDELIEAAEQASVRIYPTAQYWQSSPPAEWRYVLIGYASISETAIEHGIKELAHAWGLLE